MPRARTTKATAAQIHQATGIAVTTIHAYARQGRITRTGYTTTRAGRLVPLYDARDVLRVAAERARVRHRAPRRARPGACAAPQRDTRSEVRS